MTSDSNPSIRHRNPPVVPIHPSRISPEELQFIQNTLPTWLTEIEGQCAQIREEIRRIKNELKQLYDESQLKQVRLSLSVLVHGNRCDSGLFSFRHVTLSMLFVCMKGRSILDISGLTCIISNERNGTDTTIMKVPGFWKGSNRYERLSSSV